MEGEEVEWDINEEGDEKWERRSYGNTTSSISSSLANFVDGISHASKKSYKYD